MDALGVARISAMMAEPARARMLTSLLAGQALTASELARIAGVGRPTASAHLARLRHGRLLAVESQGRHRYFRLADASVARLLEQLLGVAERTSPLQLRSRPREPALHEARVCYDHLAGELGVRVFESLEARRLLRARGAGFALSAQGERLFRELGIDVAPLAAGRRELCRACLDWSVRRHHLAGALGAALLQRIFALRWAQRVRGSREVRFSPRGKATLRDRFPLS